MTREQLRHTYSERIETFGAEIRQFTRRINVVSLLRLAAGIAVFYFLIIGIRNQATWCYLLSGSLVVGFFVLVSLHNRLLDLRNLARELKQLNELEISCLDHHFMENPGGEQYSDPSHAWSHDLDLFGKGSLFQYLSRTSTLLGGDVLAQTLTTEPGSIREIRERQGIIQDLKERIDFRQQFTARGRLIREKREDLEDLKTWLSEEIYITKHKWLFYVAIVISLTSISVIVAGVMEPIQFRFLLPVLVFNSLILSPFVLRNNRYQGSISRKHELLDGFARLLQMMADEDFTHPDLIQRKGHAKGDVREVIRLSRLLNIFDQRLNMLLGVVFNGLFLFDFIMIHLLEQWKARNQDQILDWITLTGWMDSETSLAGFAFNHPDFCFPELTDDQDAFEVQDLGHPLIPDPKRVDNSLQLRGEKVVVITGANMAGKSTYLRSVGINMVLAYVGCPVCATEFRIGLMGLCSSMRTTDSLADEESYFLAEIRRLQGIVKRMETGEPLVILLDEVLKGTNTTDKKRGSVGLIRRSLNYPVRCLIATHDLSLGDMESEYPEEVVNYCFESYIRDLELEFDYTIRRGIATNMNASFLMKRMGIMD